MKTILPLCLAIVAMPLVLTGCDKGTDANSTAADTNTPPAAPAPAAAPAAPAPAAADTNAPAAPAPAAPATNSGT